MYSVKIRKFHFAQFYKMGFFNSFVINVNNLYFKITKNDCVQLLLLKIYYKNTYLIIILYILYYIHKLYKNHKVKLKIKIGFNIYINRLEV